MNFRWIVGVLGAVTSVTWLCVPSLFRQDEFRRERCREWWAETVKIKAAVCREWADAAQRATDVRMRYTSMFGKYAIDMELSAEEQVRIRVLLGSGIVPLALGGPSAGTVIIDGPSLYLLLPDEKGRVTWVDTFALQSRSSLRKIPDYECYDSYVHAMISEADRAFLDALERRMNQQLKRD